MISNGIKVDIDNYCKDRQKPSDKENLRYLLEVGNECPMCGKVITNFSADKHKLYEVAHIFPNRPTEKEKRILANVEVLGENSECFDNKIVLCRDCHKEYDEHKTIEKYNTMLNLKKKLLQNSKAQTALSHNVVEKELLDVVQQISSLSTASDLKSEMEPLSYTVMNVKEKIPSNKFLRNEVENLVSNYFIYLKDLFKSLDEISFETIASSFRHSYWQAKKENLDQEEIFESLVNWVKSKTRCSSTIARILVSYFIQSCDVYGKISR